MIKKRTRPQPRIREPSPEVDDSANDNEDGDNAMPISDYLELRKLRKARQGIDVAKLSKGDLKKIRRVVPEEQGGLAPGARMADNDSDSDDQQFKARRNVRATNFTGQTNALDVNKHMMAYIEENLTVRGRPVEPSLPEGPADPLEELYRSAGRLKPPPPGAAEGSVTNSMSMLTAIPEVDLGIDTRLKNIEETEIAKRVASIGKSRRSKPNDEEHLAATRFYKPNFKPKPDDEIMRDAKLEARGLPTSEDLKKTHYDRPQMATDEMVMERFKKRMRK